MANQTVSKVSTLGSFKESARKVIVQNIRYSDRGNGGTYADNDTATLTIPVLAGEIVEAVGVKLITAFDDSGAGDELAVEVGDGDDANGFVTTADLHTDQTEITYVYNTGIYFIGEAGTTDPVNATNGKLYLEDDTIDILITPNLATGTDYNLGELTAGEFEVKVYITSLNS